MFTDDTVDRTSQQKLYVQLLSILRCKIESGEWESDVQIPTEDELCRTYDVSKATVRVAVSKLVMEGFLRKWQGKGTFVANPASLTGMAMKTRLTDNMFGEGVHAKKELLFRGVRKPSTDISAFLKSEEDVYHIMYKRTVDHEPACLEESFIHMVLIPGIQDEDIGNCTFFELIQRKAVKRVSKVVQSFELSDLTGDPAQRLHLADGTSALLMHRLLVGSDGSPLAYTRFTGSGRKYRIQTEFERIR